MKESAVEILKPIEGIEVLATGTPAWYRGMRPGLRRRRTFASERPLRIPIEAGSIYLGEAGCSRL